MTTLNTDTSAPLAHTTLQVFPTGRCVRERLLQGQDAVYPRMLTAQDFFERCIVVQGRAKLPVNLRKLYLHRAIADISLESFGFEKQFLDFLDSSEFLFLFFDELCEEQVGIEQLEGVDIYAEYDDHLSLLKQVHENYSKLLADAGLYDRCTLVDYQINRPFLQNFERVEFYLEGYLTQRERDVLGQCAALVPTWFKVETHRYNLGFLQKIMVDIQDFDSGNLGLYQIDWSQKKVETARPPAPVAPLILRSFSRRIDQAAYVFGQIHDWVEREKIEPEKIAIIVPDESFAVTLELLDEHHNLNFAMGTSITHTRFYQTLKLFQESAGLDKNPLLDKFQLRSSYDQLRQQHLEKGVIGVCEWLESWEKNSEEIHALVVEEIFLLKGLAEDLRHFSLRELLGWILELFGSKRLDDVRGGRVKVMGTLESRLLDLDAVVILDANREHIPKSSEKDIFLNSAIRQQVGLPTRSDRENLQKGYYYRLLQHVKQAVFCCVVNDDSLPSPLLGELGLEISAPEKGMTEMLFGKSKEHTAWDRDIVLEHDFTEYPMSATQLKDLFECPRRYYFRYIAKIKEPGLAEDQVAPYELGHLFHEVIHQVYAEKSSVDFAALPEILGRKMAEEAGKPMLLHEAELLSRRLEAFIQEEISRREQGYTVLELERDFQISLAGIPLRGRIDRIDAVAHRAQVIDYKIKSQPIKADTARNYEKSSDFQLVIYAAAARELHPRYQFEPPAYYDVYRGSVVVEEMVEEKFDILINRLEELKSSRTDFAKTDNRAHCRFCVYAQMCGRD